MLSASYLSALGLAVEAGRQQLTALDPHYSSSRPTIPHALATSLAAQDCHPALLSAGQPLSIRTKLRNMSASPTGSPMKGGSPRRHSPRKLGKENSPRSEKENSPRAAAFHEDFQRAHGEALLNSSDAQPKSPEGTGQGASAGPEGLHRSLPAFASIEAPMTTARLKAALGDFSIARILGQASGLGCASALDNESSYELL